ncbi:VWA domain-containing protein [Streptomyces sp. 2231.1]|uniref:VWA domain-containing protein n=1 Tax=Streptomyces sp. 2231.1 TaxID=1855347 RepID=UPI00210E0E7F|nr:VWA domain-containing protein [Streptomyces sp. 2231.1]
MTGRRAAIYLILDHDWHMEELYETFAVQAFAERVLALSANLDDDGRVPVIFASGREPFLGRDRLWSILPRHDQHGLQGECCEKATYRTDRRPCRRLLPSPL